MHVAACSGQVIACQIELWNLCRLCELTAMSCVVVQRALWRPVTCMVDWRGRSDLYPACSLGKPVGCFPESPFDSRPHQKMQESRSMP